MSLSAKASALHLLSCHGKRAMRENRGCSRKGRKKCSLFRKAPSVFLQTNLLLVSVWGETSTAPPLFPCSWMWANLWRASQLYSSLKSWNKRMDPRKLVLCLVEQAQVLLCQDRLSFSPSDGNVLIGTAASAENPHNSLAVQSKVAAGFRGSEGRLQTCIALWGHWIPSRLPESCQSTWGFFPIKAKNSRGNKGLNYSSVIA